MCGVGLAMHHTIATITNGAHLSTHALDVCGTVWQKPGALGDIKGVLGQRSLDG